jgi:hypothetical protein
MTDAGAAHLATARKLLSAVLESDPTSLAETLAEQVTYQALGKTLQGAQDVSTELRSEAFGQVWRQLRWDAPQTAASAVRLIGERQPSLGERGVIVTLHFEGERIVQILQQRVPPPPPNPQPMVLPEALREAIDGNLLEKHPMVLAYVGEDAQPVQSFRGSTQVLSKDQLAMWVRNPQGAFVRAISQRPRVSLLYRNEEKRSTYTLQGRARVVQDSAVRQRVFDASAPAERAHDFAMLGVAVVIDLDRVEGWAGVGPKGQIDPICLQRGA